MSSQQQPNRDREWEHWPGRRDTEDDGIRHRLRSLFSYTASPEESAVEELIAARGRELELRTEQLAATVADLQKREERARELRSAVEDLLRRGSSELDERHAELNALAVELSRREEAVAVAEGGRGPGPGASGRSGAASWERSSYAAPPSSGVKPASQSASRRWSGSRQSSRI